MTKTVVRGVIYAALLTMGLRVILAPLMDDPAEYSNVQD